MKSEGGFAVRAAGPGDVDVVERIRADFAEDSGWPRAPLHPAARSAFPPMRVWLAEGDAGSAIAFASACPVMDLFDGPGAWLSDLFVAPAWRRRGVGRALVRAVSDWARAEGGGYLAWHAGRGNAASLAFYSSLGAEAKADHLYMVLPVR
jgi:GNAT superfamily N-acetyltransferase